MTKEKYLEKRDSLSEAVKAIEKQKKELRAEYIELSKPCSIDDHVLMTVSGKIEDRKFKCVVKSFSIFQGQIFVESYNLIKADGSIEGTRRYNSNPEKSVVLL